MLMRRKDSIWVTEGAAGRGGEKGQHGYPDVIDSPANLPTQIYDGNAAEYPVVSQQGSFNRSEYFIVL